MNNKEAKEITLEVWRYLRDHPNIRTKNDLPEEMWEKIRDFKRFCPLCELFNYTENDDCIEDDDCKDCKGCPLDDAGENCTNIGSAFYEWIYSSIYYYEKVKRRLSARKIVNIVRMWKV